MSMRTAGLESLLLQTLAANRSLLYFPLSEVASKLSTFDRAIVHINIDFCLPSHTYNVYSEHFSQVFLLQHQTSIHHVRYMTPVSYLRLKLLTRLCLVQVYAAAFLDPTSTTLSVQVVTCMIPKSGKGD
jgi:hypothetical protein